MSPSSTAFFPPEFREKPFADYTREHHTFEPKSLIGRIGNGLQDIAETLLMKFAIHGDKPVFDNTSFPWVPAVEQDWRKVREELDQVMHYRDAMPSFQEIMKEVGAIQADDQWKTFFLKGVGLDCEENARRCPETMKVLKKIPGCTTAFFSILSPHKRIPDHRGPWAGVLRLHMGLLVPTPRRECRIRVADGAYAWEEGKCLIFDDTYHHEVWNDTEGYRVVLFVDFERPLRQPMRTINRWIMNAASLAPFLREARGKQKSSEKSFWERFGKSGPARAK